MKHFVTVVMLMALVVPMLSAQVVLPENKGGTDLRENVFGLGLAGGAAGGVGLSFRHHLPTAWSYQITGGIIKVKDRLSSSIGAELQYDLARSATNRFFAGGGLGHYYSGTSGGNELEAPARLGLGIGGEFIVAPGLHTLAELFFTYFSDGTILPLPQIGFYYYFY
jgi:hypothetical protein